MYDSQTTQHFKGKDQWRVDHQWIRAANWINTPLTPILIQMMTRHLGLGKVTTKATLWTPLHSTPARAIHQTTTIQLTDLPPSGTTLWRSSYALRASTRRSYYSQLRGSRIKPGRWLSQGSRWKRANRTIFPSTSDQHVATRDTPPSRLQLRWHPPTKDRVWMSSWTHWHSSRRERGIRRHRLTRTRQRVPIHLSREGIPVKRVFQASLLMR